MRENFGIRDAEFIEVICKWKTKYKIFYLIFLLTACCGLGHTPTGMGFKLMEFNNIAFTMKSLRGVG